MLRMLIDLKETVAQTANETQEMVSKIRIRNGRSEDFVNCDAGGPYSDLCEVEREMVTVS